MATSQHPQTDSDSESQDSAFNAFGFTKIARRNLVIAIITILIMSNAALFKYTMVLNQKIEDIRSSQVDSANAQYNRLVNQIAERMKPVAQQVREIQNNVAQTDSLQKKIIKENNLDTN